MLEWMQTHRKWLVVTIWIATIAFIGAGFVGWGQFQFGRSGNEVAQVGNTKVTLKDLQQAYTQIYNQYNNAMGGKLDEATAKKLGLEKMALQKAIQDAMLREYAKNLHLMVTEEDIAKKILEYFKDKKTYMTYLKNTGQNAADFEDKLKKQLLIEKLLTFLNLKPTNTELSAIASALYNADSLEIKTLTKDDVNVSLNEKEIKTFWEKNKNRYMTPVKYKVAFVSIPLKQNVSESELKKYYEENRLDYKNKNGVIETFENVKEKVKTDYLAHKLKKEAIIAYKNLKSSKGKYTIAIVQINNEIIPKNKMKDLIQNGYVKPFIFNNSYISAKLIEEIKPKPLAFDAAKPYVIKDLLAAKLNNALIVTAQKDYKTFKGVKTGFVTKYDALTIKKLPVQYAQQFLFEEFVSQKPEGYVLLPKNNPKYAVLYRVSAQKLLDKQKYEQNQKYVQNLAQALINNEILESLLSELSQKYKISIYVKE